MQNILHHVPDPENLLALEPEELAGYILEYLNALPERERAQKLNRNSFGSPFYNAQNCPPTYQHLTLERQERVIEGLMEAWFWLEHENMLAPKPGSNTNHFFITRRGRRLRKAADLEAHRKANLLPKNLLHPSIAQKSWPPFLRGEYDSAVFLAFKEVERYGRLGTLSKQLMASHLCAELLIPRKALSGTRRILTKGNERLWPACLQGR